MEENRRARNRLPLKAIMTVVLVTSAIWLFELYMMPTWAKIRSFVLGYLVGTLINEWVHQRAGRQDPPS